MCRLRGLHLCTIAWLMSGVCPTMAQEHPSDYGLQSPMEPLPLPAALPYRNQAQLASRANESQPRERGIEVRSPQRIGKRFWVPWAIGVGLMLADAEMSVRCSRNPACQEGNPLLGEKPSRARVYAVKVPITALAFYLSQKWKRDKKGETWGWWAMPAIVIAANSAGVIANLAKGTSGARRGAQPPMLNASPSQGVLAH